ncbi:hypothetical protein DFH08DRAFT_1008347 [Mycena albidolilacea]|uniref:Uncharacterized protein n=1 Tax=Mycena albidolilacea TaxID=1033008 RepID=A0AAD7A092_9AGAR|nr:hypothetical protein DFH08DRAFT_1008347 [Mycena albidolilacea]
MEAGKCGGKALHPATSSREMMKGKMQSVPWQQLVLDRPGVPAHRPPSGCISSAPDADVATHWQILKPATPFHIQLASPGCRRPQAQLPDKSLRAYEEKDGAGSLVRRRLSSCCYGSALTSLFLLYTAAYHAASKSRQAALRFADYGCTLALTPTHLHPTQDWGAAIRCTFDLLTTYACCGRLPTPTRDTAPPSNCVPVLLAGRVCCALLLPSITPYSLLALLHLFTLPSSLPFPNSALTGSSGLPSLPSLPPHLAARCQNTAQSPLPHAARASSHERAPRGPAFQACTSASAMPARAPSRSYLVSDCTRHTRALPSPLCHLTLRTSALR